MRTKLTLAAAVSISFFSLNQPVYAQQVQSLKHLQPAKFYQAPPEFQILNTGPVVRDFREGPDDGPLYQLVIPPLKKKTRPIEVINLADPDGSNGGVMVINPNKLPKSGFGREPNALLSHAAPIGLPDGTSSGGPSRMGVLSGRLNPPVLGALMRPKSGISAQPAATTLTPAQTYAPYKSAGTAGNDGRRTSGDVFGEVKKGSLLAK